MKKFLLGALALLVANSVMTGCEFQDTDQITLSKTSVKMAITVYDSETSTDVANTDRFTITPKDGTYEVTASVEDIVTWKVSKNMVTLTAKNIGKTQLTISDMKTKATATYDVEVVSLLKSLSFTQATVSYFNNYEYLATLDTVDSVFTWSPQPGDTVPLRAFLVDVELDLYSDGFYINDQGQYDGSSVGYMAKFPGKAWYISEGLNADRGYEGSATLSTGVWLTADTVADKILVPGTFTNGEEAFEHVKLAINSFNKYIDSDFESTSDLENFQKEMIMADTMAFKGGQLIRMIYMPDCGDYAYDFMPAAIIPEAAMLLAYNQNSMYMYSVSAAEMILQPLEGDNGWGVKVEQNAITNQYNLISEGFEFGEQFIYRYIPTSKDEEEAPARKAMQFDRHVLTSMPILHAGGGCVATGGRVDN